MIKKILMAIALAVAFLVPHATLAASPASAGTCYERSWGSGKYIYSSDPDHPHLNWAAYWFSTELNYLDCQYGNYIVSYSVKITENSNKSRPCGITRSWRVNPNIIADWNPGEQTRYCQDDDPVDQINWKPANPRYVPNSDPAANRCIGGKVTKDNQWANDAYDNLAVICVS